MSHSLWNSFKNAIKVCLPVVLGCLQTSMAKLSICANFQSGAFRSGDKFIRLQECVRKYLSSQRMIGGQVSAKKWALAAILAACKIWHVDSILIFHRSNLVLEAGTSYETAPLTLSGNFNFPKRSLAQAELKCLPYAVWENLCHPFIYVSFLCRPFDKLSQCMRVCARRLVRQNQEWKNTFANSGCKAAIGRGVVAITGHSNKRQICCLAGCQCSKLTPKGLKWSPMKWKGMNKYSTRRETIFKMEP